MQILDLPVELVQSIADFLDLPADFHLLRSSCRSARLIVRSRMNVPLALFNHLRTIYCKQWDPVFSRKFLISNPLSDEIALELISSQSEYHISDWFARNHVEDIKRLLSVSTIKSILEDASKRGYVWLCATLLDIVNDIDFVSDICAPVAVETKQLDILNLFVEKGLLNLSGRGEKVLLSLFTNQGNQQILSLILNCGASISDVDLHYVLSKGVDCESVVLKRLLRTHSHKEIIKQDSCYTLRAVAVDDIVSVKCLVMCGARIDLNSAIEGARSTGMIKYLVTKLGADIDTRFASGESPLSQSCSEPCNLGLVKAILRLGAQTSGELGAIALHSSIIRARSIELTSILLEHGADINGTYNSNKRTMLHLAVQDNLPRYLIEFLVERNANMNAVDVHGVTPLMIASMNGDEPTVKILLKAGAIVDLIDHSGDTALSHAESGMNNRLAFLLRNYGDDNLIKESRKRRRKGQYF